MNRSTTTIFLVATLAVPATATGQTRPGFEVGAQVMDYNYREREEDLRVRDDGTFYGISIGYVETLGRGAFIRGRITADIGKVDYESSAETLKNVDQQIGQLEVHIGRDFNVTAGSSITPYFGIGTRVLTDNSGGETTSSGLAGYDREVSTAYLPIGVSTNLPLGSALRLQLTAQYNHVLTVRTESKFSKIDASAPNINTKAKGGEGLFLAGEVAFALGSKQLAVGPFLRRWSINRSRTLTIVDGTDVIEFFEPKNRTTEAGLSVRLQF